MGWKSGLIVACFLTLLTFAHSEKILVISFFSSKSHKITYLPLIEELGKRGHEITIVSPIKPLKEMKNVKELYTFDAEKLFQSDDFNVFDMKAKGTTFDLKKVFGLVTKTCEMSYELPIIQDLLKEKFDLIFMQPMFNDCVLGLVYRLNAPLVLFSPVTAQPHIVSKLGGNYPASITPNIITGYPPDMTFFQRFVNFGVDKFFELFMKLYYEPEVERIYRQKLGNDIPSIGEIMASRVSLLLSNGHFSLTGPKPYMPDVVDVGGIHSRPAKPLPKDLEDFINQGKDGFIVFSMGSAIKGDMMPEEKRKMILKVFSKLKQQVFWKWESETMPDLPKNVKLSKWLPMQDLMGHKDIKLFITHCGGGSTEESIYHGVPLIGIPMMADQPKNAKLAKEHGFLVELDWNELTEELFMETIQEVLNNPKYRHNVKKLSTLFRDRPQDPLDLASFYIEYVLRHKGAPHLRSEVARNLNYFQYHSYDVIGAYRAIVGALLLIISKIVKFVIKKTCGGSKKIELKAGKKMN